MDRSLKIIVIVAADEIFTHRETQSIGVVRSFPRDFRLEMLMKSVRFREKKSNIRSKSLMGGCTERKSLGLVVALAKAK